MAYIDNLYDDYFLEYASYYIKDRAIPYLDDGLKPVQRRILHALNQIDYGKFHKVAIVVGQTMQYHPHGDQAVYDTHNALRHGSDAPRSLGELRQ